MSVVKTSILMMTLLGASSLHAKNLMTFMGGGGEPKGNDTIFDIQVKEMGNFDSFGNWETQLSFNGGHSETESLMNKNFKSKGINNAPFTEASFNKIVSDYENQIKNGSIKAGDQLLLIISTHGAKKKVETELTHEISVSGGAIQNFDTGEGSRVVSLDKLENLAKLAEAKGIKLGIVDLSCHSGNTLALQNSRTCVISATGPNHYGYAGKSPSTYTNAFISKLRKGKNLEQVFLEAREAFSDLSFPMISTPTGNKLNDILYEPLTPYLYSYDPKHDKFSEFLKKEAEKGPACELPQQKQELINLVKNFQSIKKSSKEVEYYSADAKKFNEVVDQYYTFIEKMRRDLSQLKGPDKNLEKETFTSVADDGGLKSTASWQYSQDEILSYNVEAMKKLYRDRLNGNPGIAKAGIEAALANVLKIEARQQELMRLNPDFAKKKNFFKNLPKLEDESYRLAKQVASQAKTFYQNYYKNSATTDKSANPCKDFIL